LHWVLGYLGGFTRTSASAHAIKDRNNLKRFACNIVFSPHMDLRLAIVFSRHYWAAATISEWSGTPVTGPVNQPNQTLITPLART